VEVLRSFTENPYKIVANANITSPKKRAQKYIEGAFITLHPIFYLYTHHHSKFISFFEIFKIGNRREEQTNDDVISTIQMETFQQTG